MADRFQRDRPGRHHPGRARLAKFHRGGIDGAAYGGGGKISTFTANLKAYPPFTGRFQPFAKFGLGVQHSEIVINFATSGLTSIGETPAETVTFPSDFQFQATNTSVDGAIHQDARLSIFVC